MTTIISRSRSLPLVASSSGVDLIASIRPMSTALPYDLRPKSALADTRDLGSTDSRRRYLMQIGAKKTMDFARRLFDVSRCAISRRFIEVRL